MTEEQIKYVAKLIGAPEDEVRRAAQQRDRIEQYMKDPRISELGALISVILEDGCSYE